MAREHAHSQHTAAPQTHTASARVQIEWWWMIMEDLMHRFGVEGWREACALARAFCRDCGRSVGSVMDSCVCLCGRVCLVSLVGWFVEICTWNWVDLSWLSGGRPRTLDLCSSFFTVCSLCGRLHLRSRSLNQIVLLEVQLKNGILDGGKHKTNIFSI